MSAHTAFPLVSGRLSLDLVNTEVVRRGVRHDLLMSEEDLEYWIKTMRESGSLSDESCAGRCIVPGSLHTLREVRTFLRVGFELAADGNQVDRDWVAHLEKLIERAPFSYKVYADALVPIPMGPPSDALASLVAVNALSLLVSGELRTLHRCANPDCVLLFMDASGRRKWCSMKICGNRIKVARHLAAMDHSTTCSKESTVWRKMGN